MLMLGNLLTPMVSFTLLWLWPTRPQPCSLRPPFKPQWEQFWKVKTTEITNIWKEHWKRHRNHSVRSKFANFAKGAEETWRQNVIFLSNICSSLISTRLPAPVFGRGTPFLFSPLPCLLSLVRLALTSFPLVSAVFVLFCAFWDRFDGSWITSIKVHIFFVSIDLFGVVCIAHIYLRCPFFHPLHKFFIFCPQSLVCPWLNPEIPLNNEHIGNMVIWTTILNVSVFHLKSCLRMVE